MNPRRLERAWRVFATALCFSTFGAGGLALAIVFPLLHLCVPDRDRRVRLSRDVVRRSFRLFISMMRVTGVLEYRIEGLENADRTGTLILANHPSLIDTVFLLAHVRNANVIVKSALWNNLFTRGPVRAAAYIPNRSGQELVGDCIQALHRGENLIIFPEGSRTPRAGLRPFKRGAANIAVRGRVPVTPVVIRCTPPTLLKGEVWYAVPAHRPCFDIRVNHPIDSGLVASSKASVAVRRFTDYLENYYRTELHAG